MPRGRARPAAHRAGGCRTQTARDWQGSGGPRWQSRWTWRWSQRHRISLGMCLPMARPGVPRKSARARALLPPPPNSRPGRAPGAITTQLRPSPAVPSALLLPTSPTLPWETWGPAGDPKRGGGTRSAGPGARPPPSYIPSPGGFGRLERLQPKAVRVLGSGRIWGILNRLRGSGCGQTPAFPPGQPLKGTHAPFPPRAGPKGRSCCRLGSNSEMLAAP